MDDTRELGFNECRHSYPRYGERINDNQNDNQNDNRNDNRNDNHGSFFKVYLLCQEADPADQSCCSRQDAGSTVKDYACSTSDKTFTSET